MDTGLPDYLSELHERIQALSTDQFLLTLSQIDGYVTGIALAPSAPDPEEWLDGLFAPPDDDESAAIDPDQKKAISDLILKHLDEVAFELGEGTFEPLLDENDRG